MGVQRPLRAGILFRALLNGMVGVRSSEQQQNGRIAHNVCSTSCNTIPKWLHLRKLGKNFKGLLYPAGLESWDLHQQDVYSQPSEWTSFLFPDDKRDSFPLILDLCLQQSRTSPFIFTRESQSLWLICWTIRWIMSKTGFHFPPWAVEDIKISGSFDRSQPCSCLHLMTIAYLFHLWHHSGTTNFYERKETRGLLSSSMP